MATTTNYGWATPDNTDLVKDGALAIRTLGSSVDTSVKALNPETTLGDIAYRSATANTNTRLPIGTTGQVLTVSGGVPAWGSAASGGMTVLASGTLTTTGTTLSSISQSYKNLYLVLEDYYINSAGSLRIRLNSDTGTVYPFSVIRSSGTSPFNTAGNNAGGFTFDDVLIQMKTSASGNHLSMTLFDYADTASKTSMFANFVYTRNDNVIASIGQNGAYTTTGAVNTINIAASAGSLFGTYVLYGVN
jgi:hypothetical protein